MTYRIFYLFTREGISYRIQSGNNEQQESGSVELLIHNKITHQVFFYKDFPITEAIKILVGVIQ